MRHTLTLLMAMLFVSITSFSQAIQSEPNDTLYITETVTSSTMDVISKGGIINKTDSTINLKWRLVSNTSRPEWIVSFCDNNACIDLNLLDQSNYSLRSGDTGLAKVQISAKCLSDTSVIAIESWIDGARATTSILTYYIVSIDARCSISVNNIDSKSFSIYPSPANEGIYINDEESALHTYEICDLSGRVVFTQKVRDNNFISVQQFENGVYFIRVMDQTSKLVTSRKFVVAH